MSKRQDYEAQTEALILPILEKYGFELYDVEYVKEGGTNYLRAYIDKPEGIAVNDCETVAREMNPILDEKDYIPDSYVFEVSSPGLERTLRTPEHFSACTGEEIEVRLYSPDETGSKAYKGTLVSSDGNSFTIETDGAKKTFEMSKTAKANVFFDFTDIE